MGAVVVEVLGVGEAGLTPSNLLIIMNYPYMIRMGTAGTQAESECV